MARLIRRPSMEHLKLYDLDILTINSSLPPPLPPPRKHQHHRPSNSTSERYQFLCNIERNKTDPIYAATPMFRIIPKSSHVKHHRQLLGSYVPPRIIKPLAPTSLTSPEPKTPNIDNEAEEEEEQENSDEDDDRSTDNDDDDDDSSSDDESSSSSSGNDGNDDILNDDNNDKGVVQQIFDRNKRK
jgi:hypothetical protein